MRQLPPMLLVSLPSVDQFATASHSEMSLISLLLTLFYLGQPNVGVGYVLGGGSRSEGGYSVGSGWLHRLFG